MIDIKDLTLDELRTEMAALGEPAYRAVQAFTRLYKKGALGFDHFAEFPKSLREKMAERFTIGALELEGVFEARDQTRKYLFRLADGEYFESVLIPAASRRTVCLSTQVGCKFGCSFCASGRRGFVRNLTPSEITGPVLYLRDILEIGLTNVVFMGMGEPLDNWDSLERAVRILNAPEGLGVAARRMTISTSGLAPGLGRLSEMGLPINLSISLHAATDAQRSRLMPVNRTYPLAVLLRAAEDFVAKGGRMITFEYVLIAGVNDAAGDAGRLARIARRLRAKINLIPFSPVPGLEFAPPSESARRRFLQVLEEAGVRATLRQSMGKDILAACGQLAGRAK
ncbi:MAG: 23S rRNA (adenine(2503)-C(2))-methyltransferase RlmN [Candidatus Aminicenantales bacterium]